MFLKEARSKISSVLVFTLLFSLLLPALAWGAAAVPLKDIADSYAQKEIQSLVDSGIISGYEDGSFQPRKSITRAELAKILVLSLGLKENPDQAAAFTDVDKNSWYRGFVGALVQSNITQGNSATTFAPDAKVTREELAVFFIRALGLEETATKVAVDAKVSDLNTISDWAKAHVSLAFKVGFLQGIDDGAGSVKFSPKDNSERQAVARLAYEFKNNKDSIITKAKALAVGTLAVSSAVVTNNTTVEVTFNQAVGTVSASDFTFDNSLTVTKAELKSGSTTVVVLTTSLQTGGTVYKLSYLGKDTGITVTGAATGGSGSSSSSGSSNNSVADKQLLANGGITYKNIRLTASDTYGPADGSKTIVKGTLTLDPGETGEITLRNIEADNIVVASGSPNSIKLVNIVIVVELKIDTNASQTALVRVVTEGTTVIASTYVGSGAIIEATKGSFGNINIGAGAAGKEVQLRGTITDAVYVTSLAVNVNINVNAPTTGGGSTSVAALNLGANTNVKTQTGSTLKSLVVTANIKVSLDGAGTISKVSASSTVPSFALNVSSTVNIVAFTVTITIILTGDTDKVAAISIIISVGGGKVEVSPDNADVNATKDALAIGYANGDSATSVKSNLNLPTTGVNGTTVTWSSSNTAVVGNDGTITRPTADTSVTLTATISKGSITATKAFTVLVKATGNSETAVAASINALVIGYTSGDSATSVTQNLTLATTDAANGTTITWSSSNTAVVSNTGVVVRQAADTVVTLTATVSSGSNSGTKEFQVTVKASNSVTTVTYLTYNTTATVSGSVYSGNSGLNNVGGVSAFHIAAGNAADYLIVGFSENLSTTLDFSGATFTSNGTVVTATYTVIDTTYAAFKYSATRIPGEYKLEINGLKNKANGSLYNTVTFYVYQD
ncbi:S-layer homology domain-containing protein [Paenibacillus sp. FSL H7-0331]|uniref:S-layer homology domain-containing protein n=1 Tax=Paenibacillus sp. FSL H7-0331 TaxID=1920421 RepID=UPI00096E0D71|nr:S-layer homology domain-containing protein [Paenibacillus sp. FSL H7-0331]OMF13055.1 hypothetical protein BK127_20890 [Paenibacillus sp. FSL H7-0331]